MVIYEVNLSVEPAIFVEYSHWLKKHVRDVLAIDGFLEAQWSEREDLPDNAPRREIVMHYRLSSQQALDAYLKNQASGLRQEAIDAFGDQFSATRRILTFRESFTADI